MKNAGAANWDAVAACYAEDAVLMPPNLPEVAGRKAIRAFFDGFPPVKDLAGAATEIDGRGDLAFVRGSYTMTILPPGAAAIRDSGKFLEIRRRQADGRWLIAVDMFSSNQGGH
jgi:uncharacterized protein (TIGR02246 family)